MPDTVPITTRAPGRHAARHDLRFRAMTPDDMGFLCALYRSTREAELSRLPWSEAEKQQFIQMQFDAQHAHYQAHYPAAEWLLIEREGAPIGRLYLGTWPREIRIIDIALSPGARGQGLGGAILRDVMEEAQASRRSVGIHVEKTNPAMTLYRRLGFRSIEDKGVYDLLCWSSEAGRGHASQE